MTVETEIEPPARDSDRTRDLCHRKGITGRNANHTRVLFQMSVLRKEIAKRSLAVAELERQNAAAMLKLNTLEEVRESLR